MRRIAIAFSAGAFAILLALLSVRPAVAQDPDDAAHLAAPCAGCHGTGGRAPGNTIPRLAGLRENYIVRSMEDYRSNARPNEEMARISRGFDDEAIAALARYFANQDWTPTGMPSDEALAREGLQTARNRCASCHGSRGSGGVSGPRLAGQPVAYLISASTAYRDGVRTGQGARAKVFAMKGLTDEQIRALSHFYSGQR